MIRKLILGVLAASVLTSISAADLSEYPVKGEAQQPATDVAMAEVSTGLSALPAATSSRVQVKHIVPAQVASCSETSYSATPLHSTATAQQNSNAGGCAAETSASWRSAVSSSVGQSAYSVSVPAVHRKNAAGNKAVTEVSSSAGSGERVSGQVGNVSLPQSSFTSTSAFLSDKDQPSLSRIGNSGTPVRRVDWGDGENNGGGLKEPDPDPVGELPFCFMALLLAAFVLYRKHSVSRG
ncbi:MAG TPA: hypothetical protein DIW30_08215 [Bacteroidales bacterium]|nr:hypothetical protein [Bacteroidales bacterium]